MKKFNRPEWFHDVVNEHLCNSYPGQMNGKSFWIIEAWYEIESFMLAILKKTCSEDLIDKYYGARNVIKGSYDNEGIRYGDLRVGQKNPNYKGEPDGTMHEGPPYLVPEEITNALKENNLISKEVDNPGLGDILGSEWGFSDEYTTCSYCYDVIRTFPDSYSWTQDYWIVAGEIFCGDCIREDEDLREDYIDHITNNPEKANTILNDEDFEKVGFIPLAEIKETDRKEYYAGLHFDRIQHDPGEQLKILNEEFDNVLFDITSVGQFGTNWKIWVKGKIKEIAI